MRLREIQWILRAAIPVLSIEPKSQKGNYLTVSGLRNIRRALEILGRIQQFSREAEKALKAPAFRSPHLDEVDLTQPEFADVRSQITGLQLRASILEQALSQVLPPEVPESFSFHIPIRENEPLQRLENDIADVREIFEQPLKRLADSGMTVAGVDTGSLVLEIAVTAGASAWAAKPALNLVARMYAGAKDLVLLRKRIAREDEERRKLELENDILEQAARVAKAETEAKLKHLVKEVCYDVPPEALQENVENLIANSLRELADKLEAGARMQLPSNVSAEVGEIADQDLLAPVEALQPSSPKQLPQSTEK